MHPKVVQDLERSLLASMYEPLHQADRDLRVQRAREDLPAHLALVGHRRNHTQLSAIGVGQHNRSLSLWRIATAAHVIRAQPCLVAPLNLRAFLLGLRSDLRVLLVHPLLDRLG